MPQCTHQERRFLDSLKTAFKDYKESEGHFLEREDIAGYFRDDCFSYLPRPSDRYAYDMLKQWADMDDQ